ncbi:MAG: hypothetical protein ACRDYY_05570 [Acidimicrobiales bacterium]
MASLAEFSFSDLLQQPTKVASAVEERGRVVIHRRNAPDLVLSRATDLAELGSFARLLRNMVVNMPSQDVATTVSESFGWTRHLDDSERTDFVTGLVGVIQECEELGTFAPLETYIASWRSTAAILADPELTDRLTRPIPRPLGIPVSPP